MEIFDVTYRGETVRGVKKNKKGTFIKLPIRKADNGEEFVDVITRQQDGWMFVSTSNDNPHYYFNLLMRDNGEIAWESDLSRRVVEEGVFDPEAPNLGALNGILTTLYETIEQLKKYEDPSISVDEILLLRRYRLAAQLKLLGYSSIEEIESQPNDSNVYSGLRRIGEELERYRNLGAYIRREGSKGKEDIVRRRIPDDMSREEFLESVQSVEDEWADDIEFMKKQNAAFQERRGIIFDYNAAISRTIPYDEWLTYSRTVRETALLLLELNGDLLSPERRRELGIPDMSSLTGTQLGDRISRLIDSREFALACNIEDRYVFEQAKKMKEKIEGMLECVAPRAKETAYAQRLKEIAIEEDVTIDQTGKSIEYYDRVYSTKIMEDEDSRTDDDDLSLDD